MEQELQQHVQMVRGRWVILDRDLARVLGVSTKRLNERVKRHSARFSADCVFRLTLDETRFVKWLSTDEHGGRGGWGYCPFAYTEYGVLMAASIIRTSKAAEISVAMVRSFVAYRNLLAKDDNWQYPLENIESESPSDNGLARGVYTALRALG